jgi:hypothetical protein
MAARAGARLAFCCFCWLFLVGDACAMPRDGVPERLLLPFSQTVGAEDSDFLPPLSVPSREAPYIACHVPGSARLVHGIPAPGECPPGELCLVALPLGRTLHTAPRALAVSALARCSILCRLRC